MGKSIRSKTKRAYRAKKRETGVYAAAEAARLQRLNAKLSQVVASGKKVNAATEGNEKDDDIIADGGSNEDHEISESTKPDAPAEQRPRISTHGPRNSRREEWRKSKGMPLHPRRGLRRGTAKKHSSKKG